MTTVATVLRRLESLNVEEIAKSSARKNLQYMVDLNRLQLSTGETQNYMSKKLKGYANEEYADEKHSMNPLPGWGYPDLKLTGRFYKSFYAVLEGDNIEIGAKDEKTGWLSEHYEEDRIFGLTEENKKIWMAVGFLPYFNRLISNHLRLKM